MTNTPPSLEFCTRHPQQVTGRHCTRCGRPACNECLTQADVGSHCADCVRAARPPAADRIKFWNAQQSHRVTRGIIAINVLTYLWVITGNSSVSLRQLGINSHEYDLALAKIFLQNGEWYRIISSGFLHYGLIHIAMNMFLLYQLGQLLEPSLDRGRFLLLYFAALIGGSAGAIALSPNALTGGASGAVFGLMAAATVGLHQRGINPFKTGIGGTLILNLLITFTIPGISIGGHLGGAITGAVLGYIMLEPRWNRSLAWIGWVAPIAVSALLVTYVYTLT